ncbi:thiamine pyrophosphate-binding protein [Falsiroseomonas selenitidurans]|uniref:Thiamine pyrophosphate-binding protein n=1 Tax=Falsiroseomonas selenitidurans TaxID=2716335 RepID=A0ABX1EAK0_9PROT|nr:thiamine pyrophosphate-binding protein [Falsiroseomonas selenitidurans]NKC34274.1 thiamine pyrophosphate-binding protein [Falsiroseomonas selenitidurans]
MNVADHILSVLAKAGVRRIYGYPGTPLVPLLAALARQDPRRPDSIQWVLMRHENAAALAAAAEAKLTGRLGVCMVTSGPGALQAVCGVMDAQLDRAPLLLLSGLVPRAHQGHWDFQDIDQAALYRGLLPASVACISAGQAAALLRAQVAMAVSRGVATHLALPPDLLAETLAADDARFAPPPLGAMQERRVALPALSAAARLLGEARRPVVVVGRRAHGAGAEILNLAERLDAPVIAALDGKGAVDESHRLYLGVLGIFGFPGIAATARVVAEADLVVAFGVENLKPFLTDGAHVQRRAVLQVQPEPAFLSAEYESLDALSGPMPAIATALAIAQRPAPSGGRVLELAAERLAVMEDVLARLEQAETAAATPLATPLANPLDFLLQLNTRLGPDHVLAVDTGSHTIWAALFLRLKHGQRMLVSARLGTMGFCLPALIAAQLAEPGKRAIGLIGDGGFGMTGMELATAAALRLPIILVVVNNGVLQNVSAQQAEPWGVALANPDFVALARAHGGDGAAVDGRTDLDQVLDRAFAPRDMPFLIDLRCDPALLAPLSRWEAAGQQGG